MSPTSAKVIVRVLVCVSQCECVYAYPASLSKLQSVTVCELSTPDKDLEPSLLELDTRRSPRRLMTTV